MRSFGHKRILLIEDDKNLREVLEEELKEQGFLVTSHAQNPPIEEVKECDWALLDLRVGSESGLDFMRALKARWPDVEIVMMSGYGSVASAVKAMQLGAKNFISKPVTIDMILKAFSGEISGEEVPEHELSLARMEREYIDYVLQGTEGNITKAAQKLGLHRQSLQRKLRKNIPKV